ncbi:MAG: SDR family oxidoreductase [Phenylobacterium sp.]|uniref:SDR family oxidoreductase n=1 Tax=Phenylobacterium sp. TaxID=1871053 RepID=UPI001A48F91B|nr:SDR family oxidoreductase [Phenylobacterium sp.]MBL8773812.1 SDR family oxidoreductase [Phenylobacterium sp.]
MAASGKAQADGRRAIFITGAASGIGLATARRFAAGGWFVGLADIDAKGLAAALEAIGAENGMTCALDVRHRSGWKRELAAFAARTEGRLDVLVNNAGVARGGYLETQSPDEVDLQVDVNLKGVLNGCQAAFDLLCATSGSMVVNVASVAGVIAAPRMAVYAATKFAVRGLSEALEGEFARVGVGVRCIMPWFIDTPLLDKARFSGNEDLRVSLRSEKVPIYPVEEVSEAVWAAVHGKPSLHHLVGRQARQIGWLNRLAPGFVRRRLRRQAEAL